MRHGFLRRRRSTYSMTGAVLALLLSRVVHSAEITISEPQNGATVSRVTRVRIATASNVSWSDFYVDGRFVTAGHSTWDWNTAEYSDGSHTVSASAFSSSHALLGSSSVNVIVANNPGGCGNSLLAGGELESNSQAAAAVVLTPKSRMETGSDASVNATANSYYYNHGGSTAYANQLAAFHAAWRRDSVMQRVDGACNLGPHPTTAEILQWAAHKWGFSPLVTYAEATNDGDWDMASLGDFGCSVGVAQIAYCNNTHRRNHSIRGLNTGQPGHLLPQENTCFNVDLYAAFLYKHFTSGCGQGDLPVAIQQWDNRRACAPARFAQRNCTSVAIHNWDTKFFNGDPVPY
jgi:Bacterial Ig domain